MQQSTICFWFVILHRCWESTLIWSFDPRDSSRWWTWCNISSIKTQLKCNRFSFHPFFSTSWAEHIISKQLLGIEIHGILFKGWYFSLWSSMFFRASFTWQDSKAAHNSSWLLRTGSRHAVFAQTPGAHYKQDFRGEEICGARPQQSGTKGSWVGVGHSVVHVAWLNIACLCLPDSVQWPV